MDLDGSGFLNGMGLRRLRSIYRRFRDSNADLDELVERPEWKQIGQELCWLCKMGFLDLDGIGESDAAINPALEGYPKQTFLGRVRYQIREV